MGSRGQSSGGGGKPNAATEYYVSGEGMWINQYLRGRGDFGELTEYEQQYLADLDKATNGKLKPQTLYRSVDAEAIFGEMSDFDYQNLAERINYGANDRLIKEGTDKYMNVVGKTVTEKGFMSTTKDRDVADDWQDFTGSSKPIVLELKTKAGTKGVDISSYDKNVSPAEAQKEVLLARGQKYKVTGIKSVNNNITVTAEMI